MSAIKKRAKGARGSRQRIGSKGPGKYPIKSPCGKGALSVREGGQAEGVVVSFSGSVKKVSAPSPSKARSRLKEEGIAWTRQVDNELKAEISRLLRAGDLAEDGIF